MQYIALGGLYYETNSVSTELCGHGFSNLSQVDHVDQKRVRTLSRKAREIQMQLEEPKRRLPRLLPAVVSGHLDPNSGQRLDSEASLLLSQDVENITASQMQKKRKRELECPIPSGRQLTQKRRRLLEKVSTRCVFCARVER